MGCIGMGEAGIRTGAHELMTIRERAFALICLKEKEIKNIMIEIICCKAYIAGLLDVLALVEAKKEAVKNLPLCEASKAGSDHN